MNVFEIKNFQLQCDAVLPQSQLVYQTYGELNSDRSNVILYPTSYGAQHPDIEWLVRSDGILDPTKWFVIIINMFGNGLSSSPSNCAECGLAEQGFWFTHLDNVTAQEQLLREVFGIERLALVYGWSMGAQQAYHWGALYSDRVERIAAICGTAKTTDHNRIFLESLRYSHFCQNLCQLGSIPSLLSRRFVLSVWLRISRRLSLAWLGSWISQARSTKFDGDA
jgi:homoserine O-acetyltransferase